MQNELPLVSIVVPVYNVEKYLERCLKSIIQQTYLMLEIILVDDGSTDSSGEICDKYSEMDERIQVIHKENGGLSEARNVGIDKACGKYIAFIDSDDWVTEDYISDMYIALKENDSDVAVCGMIKTSKEDFRRKKVEEENSVYSNDEAIRQLLYRRISTSAWGKLYKKALWEERRFKVGKLYEDVEPLYFILKKSKKIVVINKRNYFYFCRPGSIVNQKFSIRKMDYVESCKKVLEYVTKDYPQYEKAAMSRLIWAEIHVLMHMDNPKDYPNEYELLIQDVKKNRWMILKDKQNKVITRMVVGLSFMGYKLLKAIFKIASM